MAEKTLNTRIQQKVDTSANWTSHTNAKLKEGEIGYASDTKELKVGDGSHNWAGLSGINAGKLQGSTKQEIINSARSGYATTSWVTSTAKAHDASLFDGNNSDYYLNYNNLHNKPTIPSLNGYATQSWVQNTAIAHSATQVIDAGNKQPITFKYSSGGNNAPSYVAVWNGYQITYASRTSLKVGAAATADSASSSTQAQDIRFIDHRTGVPVASYSLWPTARANRLSFLPSSQILIEQSTDGGVTWTDTSYSDNSKVGFFSQTRPSISIPLKNGKKSCDCMVRITITAIRFNNVPSNGTCAQKFAAWTPENYSSGERYCTLDGMFLWLSSNSDKIYCLVEKSSGANPNKWIKEQDNFCTGWSGANFLKLSDANFGGGKTQTGNYWFRRFTFRTATKNNNFNNAELSTSSVSSTQVVNELTAFGSNIWTPANNLMNTDRLYKWDVNQNATFPADVKAENISLQTHTHTFSGSGGTTGTPNSTLSVASSAHTHTVSSSGTASATASANNVNVSTSGHTHSGTAAAQKWTQSSGKTAKSVITGTLSGTTLNLVSEIVNVSVSGSNAASNVSTSASSSSVSVSKAAHTHSVSVSGTTAGPSATSSVAGPSHQHSFTPSGTISQPK